MYKKIFPSLFLLLWTNKLTQAQPPARSVDEVVQAYIKALGGLAAIDRIHTRELHGSFHRQSPATYYWQKPDQVLLVLKKSKTGYDGSSGWELSKRKKVKHLPRGSQTPLQIDANPLRYVHIKEMYSELATAQPASFAGDSMDVLEAPGNLGSTKFYFDAGSHLLRAIEETGETSAYFKQTIEFLDYKPVDGVQFPFRIVHSTTEPGGKGEDFRIKQVSNNVALNPEIFSKPQVAAVVLGGKR